MLKYYLFFILFYFFCWDSWAQDSKKPQLPLYEFGIAYGMGVTPDYPGSDQSRLRYLAIPTFFYRGETFRRDQEEGTRARIFKNEDLSLDFSFSGSFPTNASENRARQGMKDLDWMGEIGPRIQWTKNISQDYFLRIGIPVRMVFTTDFKYTKTIGSTFNPSIRLRKNNCPNFKFQCSVGFDSTWISGEVSDLFYSVSASEVTTNRPQYNAKSGYLGSDFFASINYRLERNFTLFSGLSYSLYSGSKNIDSPLFKSHNAASVFIGFSWFFYQSEETIESFQP